MGAVAVTIGDPTGIGPEVALKALNSRDLSRIKILLIGHREPLRIAAKICGLKLKIPDAPEEFDIQTLPRLSLLTPEKLPFPKKLVPGKPTREAAILSFEYIRTAIHLALEKKVSAITTMPISKLSFSLAGLPQGGHTEILQKETRAREVTMMLGAGNLKIALATAHIPLSQVSSSLTVEKLKETVKTTDRALRQLFAVRNPRIAVCAFNPHAGEEGLFGKEEKAIISPALRALKKENLNCSLLPADTAIQKTVAGLFDAVIALYHDQALIPLKALYPGRGYNLTLGLPFIRTSPLHGTAFDIAGKGKADEHSAIDAILLAASLSKRSPARYQVTGSRRQPR
jgi:4-hydroxythreonine-4-phosphate dehydrogenase